MANNFKISNAAAKAACDAVVDLIDAGAGAGKIAIYDGAQPAGPDTAVTTQTKLAEPTFSDPAFGAAADGNPGGVATANAISDDTNADNTGTAAWFRITDSDGNAIIDGSVGTVSADMVLNTTAIAAGSTVSLTAGTVTMPEA